MRVIAKPVQMICWFEENGVPHPLRFRIKADDESFIVIKVHKVLQKDKEKLAGNNMLLFRCQSIVDGTEKIYELKYEINTCKWILFKM